MASRGDVVCRTADEFVCETVAYQAFQQAAAREINPGDLARVLREVFAICNDRPLRPRCKELKEFLDVDLSDFPYSLAINDRPALAALGSSIAAWAERLARAMDEIKAAASAGPAPANQRGEFKG